MTDGGFTAADSGAVFDILVGALVAALGYVGELSSTYASRGSVLTRLRKAVNPNGCATCTSNPTASKASTAQYQP
jgi:hypothetical protein